jgi:hypothetical protein
VTSSFVRRVAAVFACISLSALASAARAQESIHSIAFTLKAVTQGTNASADGTQVHSTVRDADIFEACVGTPPTKTQMLSLDIQSCDDPNQNLINAVDGSNMNIVLAGLGSITFVSDRSALKTSGGGTVKKSELIPILISIECVAPDASITLSGIADVTYKPFGGTFCPETISARIIGVGMTTADPAFLANNGSAMHTKRVLNNAM